MRAAGSFASSNVSSSGDRCGRGAAWAGIQRLRPRRAAVALAEARIGDLLARSSELAARQAPDHRRVDSEQLDGAPRKRIQRGVERQALRRRAQHVVQGADATGGLPLCVERAIELDCERLRLLVQARVLNGDCELRRKRAEQRFILARDVPAVLGICSKQPDRFAADDERQCKRRPDPGFARGVADAGERFVAIEVRNDDQPAPSVAAERELEQPSATTCAGRRVPDSAV
jgi:hypothetical protein